MNASGASACGGVPFTVIGGFLGAGKTTLVNRLLASPRAPRCTVLVNDFGDIAVDAALIESHGGDTIALTNGCVCCTIGNDLERAIGAVLDSPRMPQRIVVEASGVSNPAKIADVARISPELSPAGVVVLADGAAVQSQLTERWIGGTVAEQLETADIIAASKLEQLSPESQLQTLTFLSARLPDKPLLPLGNLDWPSLLSLKPARQIRPDEKTGHARFTVRSLRSSRPVDMKKLAAWIAHTQAAYRFKGWLAGRDNTVHFCQNNGSQFTVSSSNGPSPPGEEPMLDQIRAVVIGNDALPSSEEILALIQA